MAAGDIVLFAYSQNIVNRFRNHRMIIVTWMTEFLAQIPFSNQDDADSRYLF